MCLQSKEKDKTVIILFNTKPSQPVQKVGTYIIYLKFNVQTQLWCYFTNNVIHLWVSLTGHETEVENLMSGMEAIPTANCPR